MADRFDETVEKLSKVADKMSDAQGGSKGSAAAEDAKEERQRKEKTNKLLEGILKGVTGGMGGGVKAKAGFQMPDVGDILKATMAWKYGPGMIGGMSKVIWRATGLAAAYKWSAGKIKKTLPKVGTFLKDIGTKSINSIKTGLQTAFGFTKKLTLKALDLGKGAASTLKDIALKGSGAIKTGLATAWDASKLAGKWGLSKLVNLKNLATSGAKAVASAVQGAMPGITGLAKGAGASAGAGAAKLGKLMLKGAKFIPGAGLAITGAVALYDGLSAGMREFKKSGDLGRAIKEGSAGALSGVTFGLVSQKTFSDAFTTVGDKFSSLTTGVSKATTKAWEGVKNLVPTEESLKKSFTKVSTSLAPLKNITFPEEISFKGIKDAVTTNAKAINDSFANLTGIDVSKTVGKLGDNISAKATALKKSFENVTGMTLPTFDDVKTGITTLGTNLKSKFKDITGIEIPSLKDIGTKLKSILPDISNPFAGVIKAINKSDFFSDASVEWAFTSPIKSAKGVILSAFKSIFGEEPDKTRALGGTFKPGESILVGELGPERILPSSAGTVMSASRTAQIQQAGLERGMNAAGGGGGPYVDARQANTVNTKNTSTTVFKTKPTDVVTAIASAA